MALFPALSTARSGLVAQGASLSVIANNIANVSTTGFKASRAEFADLIAVEAGGAAGRVGLGAMLGAVRTLFTQGAIEGTGVPLDLAIQGRGFFVLQDGDGQVYSRSGRFVINPDGVVTDGLGHAVLGRAIGAAGDGLTALDLSNLASDPKKTSTVTVAGTLQSEAETGTFDGTSMQTAIDSSTFRSEVDVYDAQGVRHTATVFFTKTGPNAWQVNVGMDAGELGGTAGNLTLLNGTGTTLSFGDDGTLTGGGTIALAMTFPGHEAQNVTLDLKGFRQVAARESSVSSLSQDGFAPGELADIEVGTDGLVTAVFDNGQSRALFQLAMADFAAPEGLTPLGGTLYRASAQSGDPILGVAGTAGNGLVRAGALEQSNVELAQEFIDLISTQRAYQANARVISASDQLLADLIGIVR